MSITRGASARGTERFSLAGGPLHGIAERVGLARGSNATAFGIVLGITLWLGVVALSTADGSVSQLFSLSRISGHLRLLVVIPLLFYAETLVVPQIGAFVGTLERAGVVPPEAQPAFDRLLARIVRWNDSWIPDACCLAAAIVVSMNARHLPLVGTTGAADLSLLAVAPVRTYAFWVVALTIFRFLLLRWLLRLALWGGILLSISRLDLHLVPTHPDGAAGLGYLEVVQSHFTPLVLALSIIQSAGLVEELSIGTTTISAVGPAIGAVLVVDLVLFVAPLFLFFRPLWACRRKGLRDYMELGADYVSQFDRKWVREPHTAGEPLLGTSDLQALADLGNSLTVVRKLRAIPASKDLFVSLGIAAVAPMLPLLLFKYPVTELAAKFFTRLTGF